MTPLVEGLDIRREKFPHMAVGDCRIAGVSARLFRVSFSGELGFEVNVPADYGRAIWEALYASGLEHGITPYGTETMHVLRAEKGYPIIGQDTDGTVTPHDLGLAWAVAQQKPDFIGKRSFAALLPDNAYGNVVEVAFKQAVARRGGRVVAFEKYGADRAGAARTVTQSLGTADALFLADDGDSVVTVADALVASGANLKNVQLLGTGLWDNPRVFASPNLQGGLYAAPDPSGFRSFSTRYRTKFGAEPVRTATLAYDAVALVAALARTQGGQRFAAERGPIDRVAEIVALASEKEPEDGLAQGGHHDGRQIRGRSAMFGEIDEIFDLELKRSPERRVEIDMRFEFDPARRPFRKCGSPAFDLLPIHQQYQLRAVVLPDHSGRQCGRQ